MADRQEERHDGGEHEQVPHLKLPAEVAELRHPLGDDFAVAIGVVVAVDFVDVDRLAMRIDGFFGPPLFGGDDLRIGGLELQLGVGVPIVRAGRIHLVAVEIVGRHGEISVFSWKYAV